MSRFQVSSPVIKDAAVQTEVRKLGNELLAKINILAQNFSILKTFFDDYVATHDILALSSNVIFKNYSIPQGKSGFSGSPVTIAPGATVTIPPGSTWRIII